MPSIFFSHSHKDNELAHRIAVDLRRAGISVWLDEWEIKVGHSITQRIQQGLEDCTCVCVLLTRSSVASGWVEKEWQSVIGQEIEGKKDVAVLPLKGDDCNIPLLLRDKRYADFAADYDSALHLLIQAISHHVPSRERKFLLIGRESITPYVAVTTLRVRPSDNIGMLVMGFYGVSSIRHQMRADQGVPVELANDADLFTPDRSAVYDWYTLERYSNDDPVTTIGAPYVLLIFPSLHEPGFTNLKQVLMTYPEVTGPLAEWESNPHASYYWLL